MLGKLFGFGGGGSSSQIKDGADSGSKQVNGTAGGSGGGADGRNGQSGRKAVK